MMKKKLFSVSIFLAILVLPFYSYAAIGLEKIYDKLEGNPGEKVTGSIVVQNLSDKPAQVRAYPEDFTYVAPFEGLKTFLPVGSISRSSSGWISASPNVFTIPARGKQEVTYTIDVPDGVEGSFWTVLLFEEAPQPLPAADKGAAYSAQLGLVVRMGCSIVLDTANKSKAATLSDVSSAGGKISAKLLNSGNTLLTLQNSFSVIDSKSKALKKGKLQDFYLPPEEKASFNLDFSKGLSAGNYTAVITLDNGDGDVLIKEIDFTKNGSGDVKIGEVRN